MVLCQFKQAREMLTCFDVYCQTFDREVKCLLIYNTGFSFVLVYVITWILLKKKKKDGSRSQHD